MLNVLCLRMDPPPPPPLPSHNASGSQVDASEEQLRDVAVNLVEARNERDKLLGRIALQLQDVEVERMSTAAHVLELMTESTASTMSAQFTVHSNAHAVVDEVEPMTDIRMFVHQRRVRMRGSLCVQPRRVGEVVGSAAAGL